MEDHVCLEANLGINRPLSYYLPVKITTLTIKILLHKKNYTSITIIMKKTIIYLFKRCFNSAHNLLNGILKMDLTPLNFQISKRC